MCVYERGNGKDDIKSGSKPLGCDYREREKKHYCEYLGVTGVWIVDLFPSREPERRLPRAAISVVIIARRRSRGFSSFVVTLFPKCRITRQRGARHSLFTYILYCRDENIIHPNVFKALTHGRAQDVWETFLIPRARRKNILVTIPISMKRADLTPKNIADDRQSGRAHSALIKTGIHLHYKQWLGDAVVYEIYTRRKVILPERF